MAYNQDAYPATDELQCIQIYIPNADEFKWLLAGLLRIPSLASSYVDPDSEQAQGLADIWREGYELTDWGGCPVANGYSDRTVLPGVTAVASVGSAFAGNYNTNIGLSYRQPASINNIGKIEDIALRAGSYKYNFSTLSTSQSAKIDIYLQTATGDPVYFLQNLDLYNAVTVASLFYGLGTYVPEDGVYTLYFDVVGKNAASGSYNYDLREVAFELIRQGD